MVTIKTTFYSTQKYIVQEALFSIMALHISSYLESFIYIVDRSIRYIVRQTFIFLRKAISNCHVYLGKLMCFGYTYLCCKIR